MRAASSLERKRKMPPAPRSPAAAPPSLRRRPRGASLRKRRSPFVRHSAFRLSRTCQTTSVGGAGLWEIIKSKSPNREEARLSEQMLHIFTMSAHLRHYTISQSIFVASGHGRKRWPLGMDTKRLHLGKKTASRQSLDPVRRVRPLVPFVTSARRPLPLRKRRGPAGRDLHPPRGRLRHRAAATRFRQ